MKHLVTALLAILLMGCAQSSPFSKTSAPQRCLVVVNNATTPVAIYIQPSNIYLGRVGGMSERSLRLSGIGYGLATFTARVGYGAAARNYYSSEASLSLSDVWEWTITDTGTVMRGEARFMPTLWPIEGPCRV